MNDPSFSSRFGPTRWTLVLRARGESLEARAALSELCESYYQPVLRFLQREGRDEDAARELAQEFFARVLAGGGFEGADPGRGRFRSYLLGALKHFLNDHRRHEHRQKRGGGEVLESLDAPVENERSGGLQIPESLTVAPDAQFDREWALAIMASALERLEKELAASGKADQFHALKPWLIGDSPGRSQAEAARLLGMNEGAVKVAVHRLRKRFRELVRAQIAQTLRDPAQVDEELSHLIAALS